MLFTANHIALLFIALFLGVVLGLMLSGRGKYKRLWQEEQRARRQEIREREERNTAIERRRVEEAPPPARHVAPSDATVDARHDDLTRIRAVSAHDQRTLNEAGYHSYEQIADMSDEQQASLEGRLGLHPGSIAHDQWREQARQLASDRGR